MADLEFFRQLFESGVANFAAKPEPKETPDAEVTELLRDKFAQHRADVAGPLVSFDPVAAWSAAQFTALASWYLVSRDESSEKMIETLGKLNAPRTAAEHLSTDLSLRYLVMVHRRASVLDLDDQFNRIVADTLRDCPLTGVLADKIEAPRGDMQFGNHSGLQMMFAERLMKRLKPEWIPASGATRGMAEFVFQQAGKPWKVDPPAVTL